MVNWGTKIVNKPFLILKAVSIEPILALNTGFELN